MLFVDFHWSLVFIEFNWFSLVFIGHYLSSLVFIGFHWFSLVLIGYIGFYWFSFVLVGFNLFSLVFIGIHWFSFIQLLFWFSLVFNGLDYHRMIKTHKQVDWRWHTGYWARYGANKKAHQKVTPGGVSKMANTFQQRKRVPGNKFMFKSLFTFQRKYIYI